MTHINGGVNPSPIPATFVLEFFMYRSLSDLRNSVNNLIEQQGENAPVAAFIFTKNDVFYYEMNNDGRNLLEFENYLNDEDTDEVLNRVGNFDYIYEQIGEVIDDEVKRIRKKVI